MLVSFGTVVPDVLSSVFLWLSLLVFAVIILLRSWRLGGADLEMDTAVARTVNVIGGFLSFLVIFYQNENFGRFKAAYHNMCDANEKMITIAMSAKATLEAPAARLVVRYACASAAFAIVGLVPRAYNSLTFLPSYLDKYHLLEANEYKYLQHKGFHGGDRARELLTWATMAVRKQRNAGIIDDGEAKLLYENVQRYYHALSGLYDIKAQPIPFAYIHLVRVLTATYLPIFSFVVAATCKLRVTQIVISSLAVVMSGIFFIGLQSIASKFSDPFGNMVYDLRVVKMISAMPVECEAILSTHMPEDGFKEQPSSRPSTPRTSTHATDVDDARGFMANGGAPTQFADPRYNHTQRVYVDDDEPEPYQPRGGFHQS